MSSASPNPETPQPPDRAPDSEPAGGPPAGEVDSALAPSETPRLDIAAAARLWASIESHDLADAEGANAGGDGTDPLPEVKPGAPAIPGYELLSMLGRGATATVWLARRVGSDRPVALKVFRAVLDDPELRRRAWREIDVQSQVRLRALPLVLDVLDHQGHLVVAQEYIEGADLTTASAGLGLKGKVELLARVADAVDELHDKGVLHRDLKPANILVDRSPDAQPVLVDLGLARLLDEPARARGSGRSGATMTGAVLGSPAFMAPEQARGDRAAMGRRTDVYGLGATAWLILAGRSPHDVPPSSARAAEPSLAELVVRVGSTPAPSVRSVAPHVPRGLARVLDCAVAFRPEDRYATASDLADDLRRFVRGEAVMAGRPGLVRRLGAWTARHPIKATATACATIIVTSVLVAAAAVWWLAVVPSTFSRSGDGRAAVLLARNGSELARFEAPADTQVEFAGVADDSRGDRRAVLLVTGLPTLGPTAGRLTVMSFERSPRVQWQTPDTVRGLLKLLQTTRPPEPPMFLGADDALVRARSVHIADVYTEPAGDELVVTINDDMGSGAAVVIFDLDGQVLDWFWHHGRLEDVKWIRTDGGAGLIVATGAGGTTGPDAKERAKNVPLPLVLFAVAPRPLGSGLAPGGRVPAHQGAGAERPGDALRAAQFYVGITDLPTLLVLGSVSLRSARPEEGGLVEWVLLNRDQPAAAVYVLVDRTGRTMRTTHDSRWSDSVAELWTRLRAKKLDALPQTGPGTPAPLPPPYNAEAPKEVAAPAPLPPPLPRATGPAAK